jgi:CheY-like chemotaxis protein
MARKQRILVADDDDMVRMVMRAVLAYQGYHIEEAIDGMDAVEKYTQSPESIDLVMMDVNMPSMGGNDALSRLQELNPAVKAVLLSGGVQLGENVDGASSVRYLQKPFANDELVRLVGEMLSTAGPGCNGALTA